MVPYFLLFFRKFWRIIIICMYKNINKWRNLASETLKYEKPSLSLTRPSELPLYMYTYSRQYHTTQVTICFLLLRSWTIFGCTASYYLYAGSRGLIHIHRDSQLSSRCLSTPHEQGQSPKTCGQIICALWSLPRIKQNWQSACAKSCASGIYVIYPRLSFPYCLVYVGYRFEYTS